MTSFLKTKQFTVLLHVIIWGSLVLLPLLIDYSDGAGPVTELAKFIQVFFTVSNILNIALFYFNVFWLYPLLAGKGRWLLYIISVLAAIVANYYLKMFIAGLWSGRFTIEEYMRPAAFFSSMVIVLISIIYRLVIDNRRRERIQKEKQAQQQALLAPLRMTLLECFLQYFLFEANKILLPEFSGSDQIENKNYKNANSEEDNR